MNYRRIDSAAAALGRWFFRPERTLWLTFLRIGLGIQLLLYALTARSDWSQLGHAETRRISEAILGTQSLFVPRTGWLIRLGQVFDLSESTVLSTVWWILMLLGAVLIVGLFCRATAIASWLFYLAVIKSAGTFSYGADGFTIIGLFYLAVAPWPDAAALDAQRTSRKPSPDLVGFFRRVVQLHLCVIYFFSGLTKALGSGWWNGRNLWIALTRPPFDVVSLDLLRCFRPFFPLGGIAVVFLELAYPFLIWSNRTRPFWLGAVISMHISIGIFMGMPLFATIMLVLNVAAFAPELFIRTGRLKGE